MISVTSHLLCKGQPLSNACDLVEDYGVATLVLSSGAIVRIACSWHLNAGQDCYIDASFFGTAGGAAMRNVGGSFYEFAADRFAGTTTERLVEPPDEWGGRAAAAWAGQLIENRCFDVEAHRFVQVAEVIDRIYGDACQS